jgi:hypothetical protein
MEHDKIHEICSFLRVAIVPYIYHRMPRHMVMAHQWLAINRFTGSLDVSGPTHSLNPMFDARV